MFLGQEYTIKWCACHAKRGTLRPAERLERRVDGNKIRIESPVQTEMACLDTKVMEQEQAFLTALTKATTYRIDGDSLELRDDGGALQVGFRAQK